MKNNNTYWNAGHKVGRTEVLDKLKKMIRDQGRKSIISISVLEGFIIEEYDGESKKAEEK